MDRSAPPRLSILIVSYNTRDMTLGCIRSIGEQTSETSYEIVVFDNASVDGSADEIAARCPNVKLIPSAENIGFAAASNVASRHAQGDYL